MYAAFKAALLRWLRVPETPQPPHGDPASLQVFRAGRNFLKLRLARWAFGQAFALLGVVLSVIVVVAAGREIAARRQDDRPLPRLTVDSWAKSLERAGNEAARAAAADPTKGPIARRVLPVFAGARQALVEVGLRLPGWPFALLHLVKAIAILAYLAQLPVTFVIARLDYELRWYMVTDRSLRIRHGIWKVSESTMSFANIQQVVVSQGPLQRALGLSDVKVQSAGGDSGDSDSHHHVHGKEDDLHMGLFHGVTNGSEIRDLILARLRGYRAAGLGDPDEQAAIVSTAVVPPSTSIVDAAQELAGEARELRAALL
jgi:membrane protein YdbS with pleckstrin-like domain